MKKLIFGIFAHPDDEAFGPCGTLIKEVKDGAELHLILLTSGEAGENPDDLPDLGVAREAEWREAGRLIHVSGHYNLHLPDGGLNNTSMRFASVQLEKIIRENLTSQTTPCEVEIITLEPNGLTGHIDHIVAARAASFVFYKLKEAGLPMSRIRYYCNDEIFAPRYAIDWVYADKGHPEHEIDEVIDTRHLRSEIIAVMAAHTSQRADYEHYLALRGEHLGLDHFIVRV